MTLVCRLAIILVALALFAVPSSSAEPVRREKLPNGFTILVRENPLAPVVAVSLLVDMGTRSNVPKRRGCRISCMP